MAIQTDRAPPERFEALDSWRGVAAVVVVLFHAQIVSHVYDWPLVRAGEALVDFFFVLSGFVLAHAYLSRIRDGRSLREFLFLRLGRLYPVHLFMLALFLLFEAQKSFVPALVNPADPAFTGANAPSALVSNLLLLHSIRPDGLLTWNTPSWSISAEFIVYAWFGVTVLIFANRIGGVLAAAVLAAPMLIAAFAEHGMETTAQLGAVRALYGFAAGALLYLVAGRAILACRRAAPDDPGASQPLWTLAEAATVAAAVLVVVAFRQSAPFAYLTPLVFCAVVAVFALERGAISRSLRWRPMLFLGAISYSLYMTHMFVQLRFMNVARLSDAVLGTTMVTQIGPEARYGGGIDPGNLFLGDLLVAAMLIGAILAGWLTYRLIERPGQGISRRIAGRLFSK